MAILLNKLIWDISHDKPLIKKHVKYLLPVATFSVVAKMWGNKISCILTSRIQVDLMLFYDDFMACHFLTETSVLGFFFHSLLHKPFSLIECVMVWDDIHGICKPYAYLYYYSRVFCTGQNVEFGQFLDGTRFCLLHCFLWANASPGVSEDNSNNSYLIFFFKNSLIGFIML